MLDNRIDDRIDKAARRLTEGEPAADFKARVLTRIAARSVLTSKPVLASTALAAAASVALLFYLRRPDEQPDRSPAPVAVTQAPSVTMVANAPAAARTSSAVTAGARVAPRLAPAPQPMSDGDIAIAQPGPREALPALEFETPRVSLSEIVVEDITATRLPMADRIAIEALSVPLLQVRAFDAPVENP